MCAYIYESGTETNYNSQRSSSEGFSLENRAPISNRTAVTRFVDGHYSHDYSFLSLSLSLSLSLYLSILISNQINYIAILFYFRPILWFQLNGVAIFLSPDDRVPLPYHWDRRNAVRTWRILQDSSTLSGHFGTVSEKILWGFVKLFYQL